MDNDKPMTLEEVKAKALEGVESIAKRKAILNPHKQRVVWARLTTIKRILIHHGLTTHEKFEEMANAMVKDIDNKVLENTKKDLGLED